MSRIQPTHSSVLSIECVDQTTLGESDYAFLISDWNPTRRAKQIRDRFGAGSKLWLVKYDGALAGFGWTIRGRTIEPHFFPMQAGDVHFFDFFVLPQFRGLGINRTLVMTILHLLAKDGVGYAHIECAAWNHSQVRSLQITSFRKYAEAIKLVVLGRPITIWCRQVVNDISPR